MKFTPKMEISVEQLAAKFGCTPEQVRALSAKNAEQLRKMAETVKNCAPKKYRGYTAEELTARADYFEAKSNASCAS